MSKSVFVSHVFEDRLWIDQLKDWARQNWLGVVVITGETRDVRQAGDEEVKKHLHPMIEGAAVVLLLVGNDTHNHGWVDYEIRVALSHRKHVVVARIPNTTGGVPPSAAGLPIVRWEPALLRAAILA